MGGEKGRGQEREEEEMRRKRNDFVVAVDVFSCSPQTPAV